MEEMYRFYVWLETKRLRTIVRFRLWWLTIWVKVSMRLFLWRNRPRIRKTTEYGMKLYGKYFLVTRNQWVSPGERDVFFSGGKGTFTETIEQTLWEMENLETAEKVYGYTNVPKETMLCLMCATDAEFTEFTKKEVWPLVHAYWKWHKETKDTNTDTRKAKLREILHAMSKYQGRMPTIEDINRMGENPEAIQRVLHLLDSHSLL